MGTRHFEPRYQQCFADELWLPSPHPQSCGNLGIADAVIFLSRSDQSIEQRSCVLTLLPNEFTDIFDAQELFPGVLGKDFTPQPKLNCPTFDGCLMVVVIRVPLEPHVRSGDR